MLILEEARVAGTSGMEPEQQGLPERQSNCELWPGSGCRREKWVESQYTLKVEGAAPADRLGV